MKQVKYHNTIKIIIVLKQIFIIQQNIYYVTLQIQNQMYI